MTITNETLINEISLQVLDEISTARTYKQNKINTWQSNEDIYYGNKPNSDGTRANIELGLGQQFVNTLLSKIDAPMIFKFVKRKESQKTRAELINKLKEYDSERDDWEFKDLLGKKQAIIYGRTTYYYEATDNKDYKPNLNLLDVYDFLIDPYAGGLDLENANYLGHWGIIKTKAELEEGAKKGKYIKSKVQEIIEGEGYTNGETEEDTNKLNRMYADNSEKVDQTIDGQYKFFNWFTTYKGQRYYLLITANGQIAKLNKIEDLYSSGLYPYWSWAAFPDLTEFWSPSYLDYSREIFLAQNISINQLLDNSEAINKPQKIVNIEAMDDIAQVIKYRKNGLIPVKAGFNLNEAIQVIKVPSINTPIKVFDKLQSVQDRSSGVTADSAGVGEPDGKVAIYKGNMMNVADRYGLLNKSYSFGYKKFAKLYEWGLKDHLNKDIAIDILGKNGVEIKNIRKKDIFKDNQDTYSLKVESSDAELRNSLARQDTKLRFLASQINNQAINQEKLFEMEAKISGLTDGEVRELLDVKQYGNDKVIEEANRDIERILDGEETEPNELANNVYKQIFVDFLKDHKEDISMEEFMAFSIYIDSLQDIIMRNESNKMLDEVNKSIGDVNNLDINNLAKEGNLPKQYGTNQINNEVQAQQKQGDSKVQL